MNRVKSLFHTVRHLRLRQVAGRLSHEVRGIFENPGRFCLRRTVAWAEIAWNPPGYFLAPGIHVNQEAGIKTGRLEFINLTHQAGWPPDWNAKEPPRLWQYNLHYFEWLWVLDYEMARDVALDWIARHPLAKGAVGWEPYPVSLRLMNWCAIFCEHFRAQSLTDSDFFARLTASIGLQAEWLRRHLEYRLLGNHLLENAAALAFVGSCFAGDDARRWFDLGLGLLREQLVEQIPADGLHFERSPMYHSRVVYLCLILYATGNPRLRELVGPRLPAMLAALSKLTHPDGRIALLNDSAFGIYNEPGELLAEAARLGIDPLPALQAPGPWALADAGYYGHSDAAGNYLVCDAGAIGPDYIPGHAHADTFSFELSLGGQRVIVDSGVHDYEWSEMRRYCRSTRAHNTVEIAGADQAEMWGAFRVARRGYPRDVSWQPRPDGFSLSAWHDGYRRLPGRPVHRRQFSYQAGLYLKVVDQVKSARPVRCAAWLHLHPDCRITSRDDRVVSISNPSGCFRIVFRGAGQLEIREDWYCPEFYTRRQNQVLVFSWSTAETCEVSFRIEPER